MEEKTSGGDFPVPAAERPESPKYASQSSDAEELMKQIIALKNEMVDYWADRRGDASDVIGKFFGEREYGYVFTDRRGSPLGYYTIKVDSTGRIVGYRDGISENSVMVVEVPYDLTRDIVEDIYEDSRFPRDWISATMKKAPKVVSGLRKGKVKVRSASHYKGRI
ncbi:MAG: hypothetical protein JW727_02930 [Candidatus Aenigmarchaeota archaeon]|nr:hypothetical protein [Candidatus Aenigmarchaeota archaeon]